MSPDEQLLREVLHARAEQVDTVDDFAGPSVALAHRRTRRAVVAGGAAAAVLAGGVALATWVGGSGTPVPSPLPATRTVVPTPAPSTSLPPSPSSTPTPSSTPSATATGTPAAPADAVPWAAGSTIHLGTRTLDVGDGRRIVRFAPLAGGGALVATDPGEPGYPRWRLFAADGSVAEDLGRPMSVTASRDGEMVAVQPDVGGRVTVRDETGEVLARRVLDGSVVDVADGWVWSSSASGSTGWQVATGELRTLELRLTAVSADGRRGAGTSGSTLDGTRCWRVVDLTRGSSPALVERCGDEDPEHFSPGEFSPDGRLLLGSDGSDGGFFFRMVLVRVEDGEVLVGPGEQGDRVDGWWWALAPDGDSILFSRNVAQPRFPANRNDLARCTLELECTRVEDRVGLGGGDVTSPLYVVGQPLLPRP